MGNSPNCVRYIQTVCEFSSTFGAYIYWVLRMPMNASSLITNRRLVLHTKLFVWTTVDSSHGISNKVHGNVFLFWFIELLHILTCPYLLSWWKLLTVLGAHAAVPLEWLKWYFCSFVSIEIAKVLRILLRFFNRELSVNVVNFSTHSNSFNWKCSQNKITFTSVLMVLHVNEILFLFMFTLYWYQTKSYYSKGTEFK